MGNPFCGRLFTVTARWRTADLLACLGAADHLYPFFFFFFAVFFAFFFVALFFSAFFFFATGFGSGLEGCIAANLALASFFPIGSETTTS